jgi:hypothetical protein
MGLFFIADIKGGGAGNIQWKVVMRCGGGKLEGHWVSVYDRYIVLLSCNNKNLYFYFQ